MSTDFMSVFLKLQHPSKLSFEKKTTKNLIRGVSFHTLYLSTRSFRWGERKRLIPGKNHKDVFLDTL